MSIEDWFQIILNPEQSLGLPEISPPEAEFYPIRSSPGWGLVPSE